MTAFLKVLLVLENFLMCLATNHRSIFLEWLPYLALSGACIVGGFLFAQKIPAITFNVINHFLNFPGFHRAIVFNFNYKYSCVITTIQLLFQFSFKDNCFGD